jgi:outer membrane protein
MKKLILSLLLVGLVSSVTFAQKYAFVDTDYILSNLPAFSKAQADLDDISAEYEKEINQKFAEVEELYKSYQAEKILFTEEMRTKRENEIVEKERKAKELQNTRFGVDGDLFKKRQELIQPIQDQVFTAVKQIAEDGNFAFVFDKANQSAIMFADERYNKSDNVLKILGITPGAK